MSLGGKQRSAFLEGSASANRLMTGRVESEGGRWGLVGTTDTSKSNQCSCTDVCARHGTNYFRGTV